MNVYLSFTNAIKQIIESGDISNFKFNPEVNIMLEHVSKPCGQQYLDLIFSQTSLTKEQITSYCHKNDLYGQGVKCDYGWITTSPSNLRYIFHSHLILSHMKRIGKQAYDVVEVGCGYGGLCLAMIELAPIYGITISTYQLVDLPEISQLQQLYLSAFQMSTQLEFHSATTYGKHVKGSNLFFISNYCFTEIDSEYQNNYRTHLFPKVKHGFLTWNAIKVYDIGFSLTVEPEYPLTSSNENPELDNKYVYF